MANREFFYYDSAGTKKIGPVGPIELAQLVKYGVITRDTIIEFEGKKYKADSIKGLGFPETAIPLPPPPPEPETPEPQTSHSLSAIGSFYYYNETGQKFGPVDLDALKALTAIGLLKKNSGVSIVGTKRIFNAEQLPALFLRFDNRSNNFVGSLRRLDNAVFITRILIILAFFGTILASVVVELEIAILVLLVEFVPLMLADSSLCALGAWSRFRADQIVAEIAPQDK